ncbi:MAG: type II secretion system F family protein [Acidimicrobiales bacterium]
MFDLPMHVYLGALSAAMALPVLWWAMATADNKPEVRKRLSVYDPHDLRDIVLARAASERVVQPGFSRLADWARAITPPGFVDRLERKILLAAIGRDWPLQRVLSTKVLLGVGLGVIFALRWVGNPTDVRGALFGGFMTVFGFILPDLIIGIKGDKRQEEISRSLPDILDQITISVEAGLGFDAALGHVAESVDTPLGEELHHLLQDIKVGMSRNQAFDNLLHRTDSEELRQFVLAFQQAERLGVPVAQILRIQAGELRTIRRQKAEENAAKLPVKMILPLVLFILPALVIVVLAPAVFQLMDVFG